MFQRSVLPGELLQYNLHQLNDKELIYSGIEFSKCPTFHLIVLVGLKKRNRGKNTVSIESKTTSKFLSNNGLQIAINGDGFTPWHSTNLLDVYPRSGDPVDSVGQAASQGKQYSLDSDNEPTLYLSETNKARFNSQIGKLYNAISGNLMLVRNGKIARSLDNNKLDPRTAVALDRANRYLIMIVVDGRQPGYSEGVSLLELSEIIIFHGGYNAINLDGGGSSTMVMEGQLGNPNTLNSPINHGIPGKQRVVGNHLGIYAKSLEE